MSQQYIKAVEMLCHELGLEMPKTETQVMSIRVGQQECHITEHPSGRLLMFSRLGELNANNTQALLEMSMFSQDEKKPVVGFDNKSSNVILWNHQPLIQAEYHTVYQQLELLTQYYDQLTTVVETSESTLIDAKINTEPYFDPATFRV